MVRCAPTAARCSPALAFTPQECPRRLIQVDANDIVGFEFVRDCAITHAGNHSRQVLALFHEIFGTDWVIEALTERNIAELGTTTGGE